MASKKPSLSSPLAALIQVETQNARPQLFPLRSGSCRVGAGPDNDIVVSDPAASRTHLELSLCAEGVRVRDLQSRNGTYFEGHRIYEAALTLGSKVTLGATVLHLVADEEEFEKTLPEGPEEYGDLQSSAPSMRRLFALLERLEGSLVNVLIQGESGTGKELVARALHDHSKVKGGPFVALNCGALDRSLVRSELFGHQKGAFTGALAAHSGAFEQAHGGTLFLDEVGELPLDVQPMLLRALESGKIARVGDTQEFAVNVRVLAASNRELEQEVDGQTFRLDLYHRLRVVKLSVPSLSERRQDIASLAQGFAREIGMAELPEDILKLLSARSYPGNVRELKNAILAYGAVGELPADHPASAGSLQAALRELLDVERPYAEQKEWVVQCMTRIYLELLMQHTNNNRSEAARIAGLQRGYLRRLLEKYGVGNGG